VNTLDQSVSWPDPPDLESAVQHLVHESLDDGWARVEPTPEAQHVGDLLCVLTREGVERTLALDREGERPRLVMQERRGGR
jgi:hypothetical protein